MTTPTPKKRLDVRRKALIVAAASAVAAPMEGLRQVAYYDPPGVLTVCYGSTKNVEKGKVYSIGECKARLSADMLEAVEAVDRCVPGLPDGPLIAFSDAVFNLGPPIACNKQKSTAARMLAAGDISGACRQLPRWDKASVAGVMMPLPGLTKRRAAEMRICLGGLNA